MLEKYIPFLKKAGITNSSQVIEKAETILNDMKGMAQRHMLGKTATAIYIGVFLTNDTSGFKTPKEIFSIVGSTPKTIDSILKEYVAIPDSYLRILWYGK